MNAQKYFNDFNAHLLEFIKGKNTKSHLDAAIRRIRATVRYGRTVYLVGNGGSAAIANHMAIDFTKNADVRAVSFSDSALLTTFANDYGFVNGYAEALRKYGKKGDVLIAISSSGQSENILNAVVMANFLGMDVITLSGFEQGNPLSKMGWVNFWIDSRAYGYVEMAHHLILHYINDAIIGKTEYKIQ